LERFVGAAFYYVGLSGESFYQTQIEWSSPGERVWVCHEPNNPHDELALRVETAGGQTLGYIPRGNWLRRAVHEQGRGMTAMIASISGGGDGEFLGVVISVALTDDEVPIRSYFPDQPAPEPPTGGFRAWVPEVVRNPSFDAQDEEEQRRWA
jgi:hypothetical protein